MRAKAGNRPAGNPFVPLHHYAPDTVIDRHLGAGRVPAVRGGRRNGRNAHRDTGDQTVGADSGDALVGTRPGHPGVRGIRRGDGRRKRQRRADRQVRQGRGHRNTGHGHRRKLGEIRAVKDLRGTLAITVARTTPADRQMVPAVPLVHQRLHIVQAAGLQFDR